MAAHRLPLGVPLATLYEALEQVFPPDEESFDPRPAGESALASFAVDQDGHLVADSGVLSACGWATGVVGRQGGRVDRLDGLDDAQQEWLEEVDRIVAVHAGDPTAPAPLNAEAVRALAARTGSFTRFPNLKGAGAIRVLSQKIRSDHAQDVRADFLNSFFLDDLTVVAQAADRAPGSPRSRPDNHLGRALSRYLTERTDVRPDQRVDVQQDLAAVEAAVAPRELPDGRWPSDPGHPLALSQQLAVDLVGRDAGRGPVRRQRTARTGKTTMLRDLFAARVVERAHRLAALEEPQQGFGPALPAWRSEGNARTVHPLVPELTGFEMVVASSNNAAVTNVSDEIPTSAAIAACYRGEVDYFADIATAMLQPVESEDESSEVEPGPDEPEETGIHGPLSTEEQSGAREGWALTAARLGNKSNRSAFKTRFWIGDKTLDRYRAMQPLLSQRKAAPADTSGWADARDAFTKAVAAYRAAVATREQVFDALDQLSTSGTFLVESEVRWRREAEAEHAAAIEVDRLAAESLAARQGLQDLAALRTNRRPPRPSGFRNLVTLFAAEREWAEQDRLDPGEADRRRLITRVQELEQARPEAAERRQRASQVLEDLRGRSPTTERGCTRPRACSTTPQGRGVTASPRRPGGTATSSGVRKRVRGWTGRSTT